MDRPFVARLMERLEATGKSVRKASLDAGLSESALKDILANKNASPRMETIAKLAKSLDCNPAWLAFGSDAPSQELQPEKSDVPALVSANRLFSVVRVDGSVQAGIWLESDVYDDDRGEMISAPRDPDFPFARQIAWKVVGDSMNQAKPRPIRHGDYVIGVSFEDTGLVPADGMIVVVLQTRDGGHLRQRSIKELKSYPDRTEFLPRSDDPKYKPIVVKKDLEADDGTVVSILGLVRFVFDNLPLPLPTGPRAT